MFIYWQYVTHSIAKSVWGATPDNKAVYEQAVGLDRLEVNGLYNIVTFISAFSTTRYHQSDLTHHSLKAISGFVPAPPIAPEIAPLPEEPTNKPCSLI